MIINNIISFTIITVCVSTVAINGTYIFEATELHNDDLRPTLSNGYIGFPIYGDYIYLNRFYNGRSENSQRARIPNYSQVQLEKCYKDVDSKQCLYSLNMRDGTFTQKYETDELIISLITFPHRLWTRTIVNHLDVIRKNTTTAAAAANISLAYNPMESSPDLVEISRESYLQSTEQIIKYKTKEIEDERFTKQVQEIMIITPSIPNYIEILSNQTAVNATWITGIGINYKQLQNDYRFALALRHLVVDAHIIQWNTFWNESGITVNGNDELAAAIHSSLFYLVSSMPNSIRLQEYGFGGLSPSGLGQNGYRGHSFWDTEMWMHSILLLLKPEWSEMLINYRAMLSDAAEQYANKTGYEGYRFPWESAYTGTEVTPECCPDNRNYQQHITADVAFAARQYLIATHDEFWFKTVGCDLAYNTAKFWKSRVVFNETLKLFEIKNIMGPDEFHANVSNNAFTNVIAAENLFFGEFASCYCSRFNSTRYQRQSDWSKIGHSLKLPFDQIHQYNPQYDEYILGTKIKQADTILLGYPLLYPMAESIKRNNLYRYANVTSEDGPAMTWSMYAINQLDIFDVPTDSEFRKTFHPYIRKPFGVWSEVTANYNGVGNFITGAGGFLQLIVNGYAGVRLLNDRMQITNSHLPPNVTELKLNGLRYLDVTFSMVIATNNNLVVQILNGRGTNVAFYIDDVLQRNSVKTFYLRNNETFSMKPIRKGIFEYCEMTSNWTIGQPYKGNSQRIHQSYGLLLIVLNFLLFNYLYE